MLLILLAALVVPIMILPPNALPTPRRARVLIQSIASEFVAEPVTATMVSEAITAPELVGTAAVPPRPIIQQPPAEHSPAAVDDAATSVAAIDASKTATDPQASQPVVRLLRLDPKLTGHTEFEQLLGAWDHSLCWQDRAGTWHHQPGAKHGDVDHSLTPIFSKLDIRFATQIVNLLERRGVNLLNFRTSSLIDDAGRLNLQALLIESQRPDATNFEYVLTVDSLTLSRAF